MNDRHIYVGARFEGTGGLRAHIISITNGIAYMARWYVGKGRHTRFTLPVSFLQSGSCGWRPMR